MTITKRQARETLNYELDVAKRAGDAASVQRMTSEAYSRYADNVTRVENLANAKKQLKKDKETLQRAKADGNPSTIARAQESYNYQSNQVADALRAANYGSGAAVSRNEFDVGDRTIGSSSRNRTGAY